MIIAYVISESYSTSVFNGIKVQAETWADELERQGHKVIKVNPWESHSWENYDIIHIFGPCEFIYTFSASLSVRNNRIVLSPIIDTIQSLWKYRLVSLWGCKRLRLASPNYTIRQSRKYIKHWLVRSKYEYEYVNKSYNVPSGQISIIPLSYRIQECDDYPAKEHFCLHVSRLTDDRKNVLRLMKAAVKYNFKLVLAGSISSEDDFVPFRKIMKEYDNIIYLERVSDEKLIDLYRRAKVFALPSINEGVGMVAVEAASYGCDIVVTEIGGPKEYYGDMTFTVNPYNIDEIGKAVCKAMVNMNSQPKNITASPNFNHAVHTVNSDYVHILSDDDLLMPFTVSVFLDLIEKNPQIGVFHFNYTLGINDLEKCCLLYPQIGTSMMKYYPSGKEFIYDKLSSPSFISSSLIKSEVWLYGSQFTKEDCAGYVWLSTMYLGCLEYPCMTYEVPLLIQRFPKVTPYASNWPLYHIYGISQLFWYLDEHIKGVYQYWMDIHQGQMKYKTWQTILSCTKDREKYRQNKIKMLSHLRSTQSKLLFRMCISILPIWIAEYILKPTFRMQSFILNKMGI